jgi:hypothetical protein
MMIENIATQTLQLNSHDRAMLAELIWESLEDPFLKSEDLSDQAALKLSQQRDNEIEQGKITALSHQELMNRLHNENQERLKIAEDLSSRRVYKRSVIHLF